MKIEKIIAKTGLIILITSHLIIPNPAFCGIVDDVDGIQIAVEKLTGRGNEYELNFSGWVGSASLNIAQKLLSISEFANINDRISVVNGLYEITEMEVFDKSIDFQAIDINTLTKGIEWRGKIWLTDNGEIMFEMAQKQSSRTWTSLSDYGRRFLAENDIERLDLGD